MAGEGLASPPRVTRRLTAILLTSSRRGGEHCKVQLAGHLGGVVGRRFWPTRLIHQPGKLAGVLFRITSFAELSCADGCRLGGAARLAEVVFTLSCVADPWNEQSE